MRNKRIVAMRLAALLTVCTASAEEGIFPGQTVTVVLPFFSAEGAWASVDISYDTASFAFVGAEGGSTSPQEEGQHIFILGTATAPIGSAELRLTLRVREDATPGVYAVLPVVTECWSVYEQPASSTVTAGQITVLSCGHAKVTAGECVPSDGASDGSRGEVRCDICGRVLLERETIPAERVMLLPEGTEEIGDQAFMGTDACQVTLSGETVSVGSRAFADCPELYLVVLPESVSVIAEDAFEGTENVLLLCPGKNDCVRDWAAAHGMIVIGE